MLGRGAGLQVVLSVQPPQPQQLTVTVERVPSEGQRKGEGREDTRRGQDLEEQSEGRVTFSWSWRVCRAPRGLLIPGLAGKVGPAAAFGVY